MAGLACERDELHRGLEAHERVGEAVRRVAELGGEAVGLVLALRREQQVHDRCRDGPSTNRSARCRKPPMRESSTIEPASTDRDRLDEDVAVAQVRDLVRDDALELGRRADAEQADRQRERGAAAGAAACRQRPRVAVAQDVELAA